MSPFLHLLATVEIAGYIDSLALAGNQVRRTTSVNPKPLKKSYNNSALLNFSCNRANNKNKYCADAMTLCSIGEFNGSKQVITKFSNFVFIRF